MADSIQQFIENYFRIQAMSEQARQFNESQDLARRQTETQEIQNFVGLAQNAQRPAELGALAEFFTSRNPQMGETFSNLMMNIAPNLQTQQAGAVQRGYQAASPEQQGALNAEAVAQNLGGTSTAGIGVNQMIGRGLSNVDPNSPEGQSMAEAAVLRLAAGMSPGEYALDQTTANLPQEALSQAVSINQGRSMSAPQAAQNQLGWAGMNLDERRFSEGIRQFGINTSLEGQRLNLSRAQLAQQGELGHLGIMQAGGLLPMQLQGQLSQEIQGLQARLQRETDPAVRRQLQGQINDAQGTIRNLGAMMAAKNAGTGARLDEGDLPGLMETRRKLITDLGRARSSAERQEIQRQLDATGALIGQINPNYATPPVGDPRGAMQRMGDWFFQR